MKNFLLLKKIICCIIVNVLLFTCLFSVACSKPSEESYLPLTSEVVFVSENGTGSKDGSSPENTATLQDALGITKRNGGTIVITNAISLDNFIDEKYFFPSNQKPITITSLYDGVDYRVKNDASITVSSIVSFYGDYCLKSLILFVVVATLIFAFNITI